jgi:ribosomal protein S18 acetylase RimI-like enzyme
VADADVDAFAPLFERLVAAGIGFTTLRELQAVVPLWLERFTVLDNETRSATGHPEVPRTVATMTARLAELELDPEACFVAREGAQWVGYTVVDTVHSSAERLHQSWTGVLPSYRRRGIGTALKILTVGFAREHGYALIDTRLRADNVASQELSRRVGFRPAAG